MRTTLSIDDDVLVSAKAIARQQNRNVGEVISELARRSLQRKTEGGERNGVPLLAGRADSPLITLELVNRLRDEAP